LNIGKINTVESYQSAPKKKFTPTGTTAKIRNLTYNCSKNHPVKVSLFFITFIFLSCHNDSSHPVNKKRESIDKTAGVDTTVRKKSGPPLPDTFILHPTGFKDISKFRDTTINGIRFDDCDTITELFGNNFKLLPDIDDLPALQILNSDKTQLLTMYMWNGNAKCDFSQYQIEYNRGTIKFIQKPFVLDTKSFISVRKISLGITQNELKAKIGQPNEIKIESGLTILSFQEYSDLYFADYYFKGNRLIKFRFGEEYP
jgi:hypothetical protein